MSDPSFLDYSDEQIRDEAVAIAERESQVSNRRTVGVWRGLVEAIVLLMARVYRSVLTPMLDQLDRRKATGLWLTLHAAQVGLSQIPATRAAGTATATVTAAGTLAEDTAVVAAGVRFRVTGDVALQPGDVDVPIEALQAGSASNLVPGTAAVLDPANAAISAVALGEDWLTSPARDDETEDELRERLDARWMSQGPTNLPERYTTAALSAAGISRVHVVRTPRDYGSVDVVVAPPNALPSTVQLAAVRTAMADDELICRDLLVRAPQELALTVRMSYVGGPASPDDILRAWLTARPIGQTLRLQSLYVDPWIGRDPFVSLTIGEPTADVVLTDLQVIAPTVLVV